MTKRLKFTHITRVIDPKTRIHYLDAIDENGYRWEAQMTLKVDGKEIEIKNE